MAQANNMDPSRRLQKSSYHGPMRYMEPDPKGTGRVLQKSMRRPTLRQRIAVGKLVENGGNFYRAMIAAGYSEAMANNPSRLRESKGFKEAAAELGLTEELLVTSLVADIKSKRGKRKGELELGFKVLGIGNASAEPPPTGNTYNTYVQQNNFDPNNVASKDIVSKTLDSLMKATQRKTTHGE